MDCAKGIPMAWPVIVRIVCLQFDYKP